MKTAVDAGLRATTAAEHGTQLTASARGHNS